MRLKLGEPTNFYISNGGTKTTKTKLKNKKQRPQDLEFFHIFGSRSEWDKRLVDFMESFHSYKRRY